MVRRWSGYYKERILELLPVDGSRVRSTELYKSAGKRGLGFNTVRDYLDILRKEGAVKKLPLKPKEIYYCRCEGARLENLIDDFMREINGALSALPKEMTDFEKKLIEGSRPGSEIEKGIEFLRKDPVYLRGEIITALYHKVNELVKANFFKGEKDKEYYIGDFGRGLHFVPRGFVEYALKESPKSENHSVKS